MLKITQVKSRINRKKDHKATLDALGISKMNQSVFHEDTPSIRGHDPQGRVHGGRRSGRRRGKRIEMADVYLHNLKPDPGSRHSRKRVGRGAGSGLGKTSGRGHGGSKKRSGGQISPRYEGGQMPLHMRLPKLRGPLAKTSMPIGPFRTYSTPVNLSRLEGFAAGDVVSPETLLERGIIKKLDERIEDPGFRRTHGCSDHQGSRVQRGRRRQDRSRRWYGGSDLGSSRRVADL